jgi:uncharacterized protein
LAEGGDVLEKEMTRNVEPDNQALHVELLRAIRDQFRCDWWGYHGVRHWARVRANTRSFRLTEPLVLGRRQIPFYPGPKEDIDQVVCDLFAVFHDACRINEYEDPGHGARGAALAQRFRGKYFQITDGQMEQLVYACTHHTDGLIDGSPTVQACWDADRCDLPRVGIDIDVRRLCHPVSKNHPQWLRMVNRSKGEWEHQHSRHHSTTVPVAH